MHGRWRYARRGGRRFDRGFSLVELVTAVGVVAIVAAVGVPQLAAYNAQYRLTSAARQLAVDLTRARMKAIGENLYVRVQFGSNNVGTLGQGNTYQLAVSNDGTTYTNFGQPVALPSGVSFYALPSQVSFNRQGFASAPTTVWAYNYRYQWRVVTLNSLGKATVQ